MSGETAKWKDFEASLDGAFSARAKGFLGSEFSLSGRGGEFGTLRLEGSGGASFEALGIEGRIESSGSKYWMLVGGEEVLFAARGRSGLRVECVGTLYEASVSLFRNTASARTDEGKEAVRVSGGMSNRRYEAAYEEESLPVAVFLLYYVASSRRRAFRAGAATSAGR